jgi:hypothetical protein
LRYCVWHDASTGGRKLGDCVSLHSRDVEGGDPDNVLPLFNGFLVWAITGPIFGFSYTWRMIQQGDTIVTFLMVFPHSAHRRSNTALGFFISRVQYLSALIVASTACADHFRGRNKMKAWFRSLAFHIVGRYRLYPHGWR